MYWNTQPRRPTRKTIKKFAIIPIGCENNHIHWLEEVSINKRLIGCSYSTVDVYDNYTTEDFLCNCNIPTKS